MAEPTMTPWQRFLGLIELEKRDILQIFYYAIFSGVISLTLPLGIQAIINLIQGAQVSTSWIVLVVLVTVGVAFAGGLQIMQLRILETIQQRVFMRSSFELSYRFPKIKMAELRNYHPPELANRFFDTITFQKSLSKILIDVPTAVLQTIFALILLSFYHSFFIIFGVLLLILIFVIFKFTAEKGLNTSLKESKNKYKVAHWIQEIARTVTSFKLSGSTSLGLSKNDELVSEYLKSRESHFKILMLQFIQMISFKVIVTASLLLIGGALVLNQEMNIGQFVAAEIIILLIIGSVEKLILGLESFYDALTSIEKIGQIVDKEMESQEGDMPVFKNGLTIELDQVSYSVSDKSKPILNNISLKIKKDSRILITGESGSGKSTLLRLIAGVNEATSGAVYVNDMSISSLNLNHFRSQVGVSFSEETPFDGSIRENLTFGNPAITDEKIFEIIDKVGLRSFIKEQPQGLNTIIQAEGNQLSFTVSKKIILARAVLKSPKILILEKPLNKSSKEESLEIIEFLTNKSNPWSVIVISNDKNWAENCTELLTLENGNATLQNL
ncbi:ATP-binding cassette domain-containing protein [Tamlana sp. 2_MG-2023]|uniref:peptidase domain-containing ABC transporter n=1 Tax=unclassified Tamlana TaxID=2614803 RepID=UPI0026E29E99|nr:MULTISPECIES: ATP-binding cassette domain-containing protein [unclassified Tamlana]MDO6758692.1 ATP-binding cassette domain-containing protein [Tamlana sp. 2_MG-2023]MDO6789391.1 ATP-binding cassette domain-containing protein [Tamlana sp. 1_MG-2023]